MTDQQRLAGREPMTREYEYDDGTVLVTDVGPVEGSVDIVDGTAIVVVDGDQYELELPAGEASGFMKNGVVTIEVEG